ncbi:MAG: hypothetical protein PHV24_08615 [Candidatus Kapabacteria bacterium]|nr:hypothetical protein [Candidatus Kapabacteria bacterium]
MQEKYKISLKRGEIVKGRIIEPPDENNIAVISLPNCTMTAEVLGELHAGEEVMFLVESVTPGIVLSIYRGGLGHTVVV